MSTASLIGSLDVRVYLSHRGHHLYAQLRGGARHSMNLPNVGHELREETPDVRSLLDMGAAGEDVLAPQFSEHLIDGGSKSRAISECPENQRVAHGEDDRGTQNVERPPTIVSAARIPGKAS